MGSVAYFCNHNSWLGMFEDKVFGKNENIFFHYTYIHCFHTIYSVMYISKFLKIVILYYGKRLQVYDGCCGFRY